MNNKYKINIPLLLAGILFCLTLISSSLTSNLIAKYSTTASGSDGARVAKFDVITTKDISQLDKIELVPGDSDSNGTYKFTISNNSEVVVKNSVIVKDVPENVQVKFNDSASETSGGADITFDVGVLDIGASVDCSLTFSALDVSTTQVAQVTIQVVAEQVD
ncbi:hypothetical protein ACTQ07_10725 [Holdemanella porci]|uniref:hypothetical protein n=1 Tax=Holdemanella porci TaxID=2652276 RepID=UPI003F905F40